MMLFKSDVTMANRQSLIRTARQLNCACRTSRPLPPLFFFTDENRIADTLATIGRLPPDTGVIFRHYGHPDRAALAREVTHLCRPQKRLCLVAGSARLARDVGADGVHWPEHQFRTALAARRTFPIDWIITTSAHSLSALFRIRECAVNGVFLSPVFPTESHPGATAFLGPLRARMWIRQSAAPVYLLGGIDNRSAARLKSSGAAGFGAIGSLLSER